MPRITPTIARPVSGAAAYAITELPTYRGGAVPPSYTYATWSPTDQSGRYDLSEEIFDGKVYQTATKTTSSVWDAIRATVAITEKSYWEMRTPNPSGIVVLGVIDESGAFSTFVGGNADGWGYYGQTGSKTNSGSLTAYGLNFNDTNYIGISYDPATGDLEFYRSGVSQGVISATGLSGAVYPACSVLDIGSKVYANFGGQPFVLSVPSGCRAGVYTS